MAYQTTNPYNNQVIKTYQNISDADLAQALTATHQQYQDWRSQPVSDRAVILHRIAKLMRTEKTSLAKVVTQEMGKLIGESEDEVELCANIADYFADHAADFWNQRH